MKQYEIPGLKIMLVRDGNIKVNDKQVLQPETAANVVRRYLEGVDREHLVVLLVDAKLNIVGINTVSIGTIDSTTAHPREIFKPAILAGAHGIIIAHNHPSGDSTPSPADKEIHRRIRECGKLLEIELLDAIIIGQSGFYSAKRDNAYEF